MFYKVVRALCAVFLRLAFRFRVVGLENVPDGGGFILAANHRSNWLSLIHISEPTRRS